MCMWNAKQNITMLTFWDFRGIFSLKISVSILTPERQRSLHENASFEPFLMKIGPWITTECKHENKYNQPWQEQEKFTLTRPKHNTAHVLGTWEDVHDLIIKCHISGRKCKGFRVYEYSRSLLSWRYIWVLTASTTTMKLTKAAEVRLSVRLSQCFSVTIW